MFAANIGLNFETLNNTSWVIHSHKRKYFHRYDLGKFRTRTLLDVGNYEVIVLIGPPGSGKSTITNSLPDYNVVSRDILRYKAKCVKLMNDIIKNGEKVIVDNTIQK